MSKEFKMSCSFIGRLLFLLIALLMLSEQSYAQSLRDDPKIIARIFGRGVPYSEFSEIFQRALENFKSSNGSAPVDEQYAIFRDQVWDAFINEKLAKQAIAEKRITVTDKEINDIISGPKPPDYLTKNFIDSTGKFNRAAYDQAIADKRNESIMAKVREGIKQQLLQEKLTKSIYAGTNPSDADVQKNFIDQNVEMKSEYILAGINLVPDSLVLPSEAEVKSYYDAHQDEFKIKSMRKIKYVYLIVAPSKADSDAAIENLNGILKRARNSRSTKFSSYASVSGGIIYSKDTMDLLQVPAQLKEKLESLNAGDYIEPFFGLAGGQVYKYLGSTDAAKPLVRASHILIPIENNDTAGALTKVDEIYKRLEGGEDFAELAKQESKDPGSAMKGGDLDWFGEGKMVREFEQACFSGAVNEIQKPVLSQFGYHIIKVTEKNYKRYAFERLAVQVKISKETRNETKRKAADFALQAARNGFDAQAGAMNLAVQQTAEFAEDVQQVPGIGGSRSIVDYVFESDTNQVSSAVAVSNYFGRNGYLVFTVNGVVPEGIKKITDVDNYIKGKLMQEKKFEAAKKILEEVQTAMNGNFSSARSINPGIQYDSLTGQTPSAIAARLGIEINFPGSMYKNIKTAENYVIGPVKGMQGYYLVRIIQTKDFDKKAFTKKQKAIRDQLTQEKKQRAYQDWMTKMKERAKIVDYRFKFF